MQLERPSLSFSVVVKCITQLSSWKFMKRVSGDIVITALVTLRSPRYSSVSALCLTSSASKSWYRGRRWTYVDEANDGGCCSPPQTQQDKPVLSKASPALLAILHAWNKTPQIWPATTKTRIKNTRGCCLSQVTNLLCH